MLIGSRGSGKSTLAPRLAQELGWSCIDLDELISNRIGDDLSPWITTHGWAAFRTLERQTLAQVISQDDTVIACGAGIVEGDDMRTDLRANETLILWLDIDTQEQERRLKRDTLRPRLEPGQRWVNELEIVDQRRRALYQQLSDQRIDAAKALDQLLVDCIDHIKTYLGKPQRN